MVSALEKISMKDFEVRRFHVEETESKRIREKEKRLTEST